MEGSGIVCRVAVMEGETGPAIKCNVTAGPETCQPRPRADILARRPRVPDLQPQQLLTAPVDEALHS